MKVFNISLHRTGTQSFINYCKSNGLSTQHWPGKAFDKACSPALEGLNYDFVYKLYRSWLEGSECFADLPIPIIYEQLINDYQDAYFVVIYRDPTSWLKSARNHVNKRECDNLELLQYSLLTGDIRADISDYTDDEMINSYMLFHTKLINMLNEKNRKFLFLDLNDPLLNIKLNSFLNFSNDFHFNNVDITK
ncbi:hypothetical protein NQT63_18680 [Pseudoalteromonas agarivorans]|uniref:sulfotransferase n=1 Tax=Pseudoalteromonas agarivorans TaxID=176102 RepID=UPI0021181858|nr:sulfotransferase [Pseudoalteromonas agarivorans]MCQ8887697.1 hypothetical protein [Pseudoalteromonas agarivorans]